MVDEVHRIGHPGVLGLRSVVVVRDPIAVEHHVLQHASESDRVPDLRLPLLREVDALRVAAALRC